jgi:hypothetical protein
MLLPSLQQKVIHGKLYLHMPTCIINFTGADPHLGFIDVKPQKNDPMVLNRSVDRSSLHHKVIRGNPKLVTYKSTSFQLGP